MFRRLRRSAAARLGFLLSLLAAPVEGRAADGPDGLDAPGAPAAAAAAALTPALFDMTVNGQAGSEPATFLRDARGRLYLSGATLRSWRLRVPAHSAVQLDDEFFYPASALPRLRVSIDEATQSVAIVAEPDGFELQEAAIHDDGWGPMTPSGTGGFLNYDLFAEHVRGETSVAGAFEAGFFTRHGAATTTFIASAGGDRTRLTRLETTWTIDRPNSMTSIRIGDAISAAGPGTSPVRFGGIQYARNFAVRPGFLTMPLPIASGSAAVPSIVDVYVNSALQSQQQVAPGPFELSNVPVPSGGGTVQLVVRDLLGREIVTEQSYYASAGLLRRGLHDFSYEAGFLREGFGKQSNRYGSFFISTAHRYGFSDRLTGEATVQASRSLQVAGVAASAILFDLAQVGGSVAVSHSRQRGTGFRVAASAERRTTGLSFGLLADYASSGFTTLGRDDARPLPRFTVQAFADLPWSRGAIGVNLLHRTFRGEDDETLIGVFGSWRISDRFQFQAYARHSILGIRRTSVGAHLSMALGGRRSASASLDGSRREQAATLSYQDDPPAGIGGGYRVTARLGEAGGAEATYTHNFRLASVTGQLSHARGDTGVRLSAAGSIGMVDGRVFASRSLGDSFATVEVPGFAGVRVYAENQPVGRTDRNGFIVIPGLRAFERNTLRIEQGDLPLDATIEADEMMIRPFARAGAAVRFAISRERGALLRVRLPDGTPLPSGAQVRIEGRNGSFVVVTGGEVYVPDLAGAARLTASWAGGQCSFPAMVPESDDPQPRIDNLVCRSQAYAAR